MIFINDIIFDALNKLRGEEMENVIIDASNRHMISLQESGEIVSYYFSVPTRAAENSIAIAEFHDADGSIYMSGTNCKITIGDAITFDGVSDRIRITIPATDKWCRVGRDVACGDMRISPTLNGVVFRKHITRGDRVEVIVASDNIPEEIQKNSKHFAFMKQRFVPSFTASPVGIFNGEKIGALLLDARSESIEGQYCLIFTSPDADGEMCVEFNMYEPKLIQDTTVESVRPEENNAYGTTAFVGHSDTFGAQQMYLKFNYPALGDFGRDRITSIKLYLPILGGDAPSLEVLHMDNRFCSFGSVWNRRVKPSGRLLPMTCYNGFCLVDLTDVMTDRVGRLRFSNGIHLRVVGDAAGYCCLATGDSHLHPPILEVRHSPQ